LKEGFEIRSLIALYNGMGSQAHFRKIECEGTAVDNPALKYPEKNSLLGEKSSFNSYRLDFVKYTETLCKENFAKK
jgi:hypothetical protein